MILDYPVYQRFTLLKFISFSHLYLDMNIRIYAVFSLIQIHDYVWLYMYMYEYILWLWLSWLDTWYNSSMVTVCWLRALSVGWWDNQSGLRLWRAFSWGTGAVPDNASSHSWHCSPTEWHWSSADRHGPLLHSASSSSAGRCRTVPPPTGVCAGCSGRSRSATHLHAAGLVSSLGQRGWVFADKLIGHRWRPPAATATDCWYDCCCVAVHSDSHVVTGVFVFVLFIIHHVLCIVSPVLSVCLSVRPSVCLSVCLSVLCQYYV